MKLQVSGGIDSLTLIDEHGHTVCTFAVCDEDARRVANEIVRRFNEHDTLIEVLEIVIDELSFAARWVPNEVGDKFAIRDSAQEILARFKS